MLFSDAARPKHAFLAYPCCFPVFLRAVKAIAPTSFYLLSSIVFVCFHSVLYHSQLAVCFSSMRPASNDAGSLSCLLALDIFSFYARIVYI